MASLPLFVERVAVTPRPLRSHQTKAMVQIKEALLAGNKRVVVAMPTGAGKCLGRGTPVLMADGRIVPVEKIVPGDRLASPAGGVRTVLSTTSGRENLFRVMPVKGDPYVVNASHLLVLRRTPGGDVITLSDGSRVEKNQDIAIVRADVFHASSATARHVLKGWRASVQRFEGEASHLPVPAYILGIWIGDGTVGHPEISKPDGALVEQWREYGRSMGLGCVVRNSDRCPSWTLTNGKNGGKLNPVRKALEAAGVWKDKHIPHIYLTSAWDDRLELLAGLLDSDGHLSNSGYDFISKSEQISNAVCFLARSVGLAAYVKSCTKAIARTGFFGTYWRVSISGECSIIPCRQKPSPSRKQIKRVDVTGLKLEPLGEGDYYGFELDGDRLFMLGDFTVTHNTRLAAEIVSGALRKGNRVAFTVPAISLVDQTVAAFEAEGIDAIGVMQGNHDRTHYGMPVQVCSVQSLARRAFPHADVVVVDECHVQFEVVKRWIKHYPKTVFVGLSATPWARGMSEDWQALVTPVRMQELIDAGFLSPFRVYAPSHPDLSGVKTMAGDYHEGQLAEVMGDSTLIADVVETWQRLASDLPTLVFAVNRVHASTLQEQFAKAGVRMGYCDAYVDLVERKVLFDRLARGEIAGIVNVGTLTTGVDADIRCVVLARPTKSEMLFVQMIGRALRTAPGKDHALILDHADNHARLGFVTDIHHPALLDGREKTATRKEKGEPMPKECPACGVLKAPKVRQCGACGFEPVARSQIETEQGELIELRPTKKEKATATDKQRFWSMANYIDRDRGKGGRLAKALYKGKFGVWPKGLNDSPIEPDGPFLSYERSRRIAYAKSRGAGR